MALPFVTCLYCVRVFAKIKNIHVLLFSCSPMLIKRILAISLLIGSFELSANASSIKAKLNKFDADQNLLKSWNDINSEYSSKLLCVDNIKSVQIAVQLLNQKYICRVTPTVEVTFSDTGISSMDEIVRRTILSPSSQADFKTVEASRYMVNSSFASAFLPTLEVTDAFIENSDTKGKISSKTKSYSSITGDLISDGSWTYEQTNTSSSPQYYTSFAFTLPIYNPYYIQYYSYYKSSGKANAFSATDSIDSNVETALTDAVSLWVSYKQIKMNKLNIIAAIESLDSTIGQFKIGSLALPDVAQSLSTLRSYQSELASEYETYFSAFNSLASQLGMKPSKLSLKHDFVEVSFLDPLLTYSPTFNSDTLQASVSNSNAVYNYLYLSSSYLDLGKSYLATYLPSISLSLGYNYSTNSETVKTSSCSSNWNCDLTSKADQFSSSNDPSIALNFSWTLFDSGSAYYEYRSNKMTAESEFDNAINAAYEAIESISTDFQQQSFLDDEIDFSYSALSSIMLSYSETLLAYKAGFSDTTSLVQRLTALVSARSTFLSSVQEQLTNKLSIMQSLRDGIYSDSNYFELDYNQDLTQKLNVVND